MIGAWMVYCIGVSALLALSALALEHGLRLRGIPLRWVWVWALIGSLSLAALPWFSGPRHRETGANGPVDASGSPSGALTGGWTETPIQGPATTTSLLASLENLDRPLLLLWALLSASGVLFLAGTQWKLERRRRRWRCTTVDGVPVLVSRDAGPAVVGFFETAIVIPHWVLRMDPEKRWLVLAHETEHLRARDTVLLALSLAALALMPWNVPLWWQLRRLRHAVEMDCDARVLRICADVRGYSALLIEVGERISMPSVAFAAFSESTSFLERRIRTMITLKSRRWKLALSASIVAGVGLLVLACEAPRPTMPSGATGPTAEPAPQIPSADVVRDSPAATRTGTRQSPSDGSKFDAVPAIASTDQEMANGSQVVHLVQRMAPEIYAKGLPLDHALWIAINHDGTVRKSWIGPNLYINMLDGPRPNRAAEYPRGSAAARRAAAERERVREEILRENVPDMKIRGGWFALMYGIGPKGTVVHVVAENAGFMGTRQLPVTE